MKCLTLARPQPESRTLWEKGQRRYESKVKNAGENYQKSGHATDAPSSQSSDLKL